MTNELGKFEEAVLSAIIHLGENAYGVTIRQKVSELTKKDAVIGAVYTTLSRLEQKKMVKSKMGEPTPERGGRRKKYYTITNSGREAVIAASQRAQRLWTGDGLPEAV